MAFLPMGARVAYARERPGGGEARESLAITHLVIRQRVGV